MTTCTICSNPRVAELDAAVGAGRSHMSIGARFGISRKALGSHVRSGHVVPTQTTALDLPELEDSGAVDALAVLESLVRSLAGKDTRGMSPRDVQQHGELLRRAASDLSRLQPPKNLETPAQEALTALQAVHQAVADVLERFPEAKAAVGVALKALRLDDTAVSG